MFKVIDLIDCTVECFDDIVSAEAWAEFLIIQKNDRKQAVNFVIVNEEIGFLRTYQTNKSRQFKSYDITLGTGHRHLISQQHDLLFSKYVESEKENRIKLEMLYRETETV